VLGGKTGFISSSGYCLATLVRLPQTGRQVAVVVLGARSNAGRFAETKHLFNWLSGHMTTTTLATDSAQQNQQQ
jgi:D-alanyl-D-alanine carboxypeptidase